MASDARISVGLPGHPKTKKLMRRLGAAGPLGCIYLFIWAASNRSDGNLSGMTDEDIELAVDWAGDDGVFVAAMVEVGFLDGEECGRSIHDWAEHNPWAAGTADRAEASKWAALCKRYGRDGAAERMPEYAIRTQSACAADAGRTKPQCDPDAPSPSPSPSPLPIPKEERAQAPLPDWVPVDSWAGYVEMRKKIRKPMTARAVELIVKKLSAMQADGIDIAGVLDLSTSNAWTDVWRPTERAAKASAPTPKGDIDAYCATHRNAAWWADAGFANVYEATSSKCFHHNAAQFRDGKKCEVAA